jgi:hypothetical protein
MDSGSTAELRGGRQFNCRITLISTLVDAGGSLADPPDRELPVTVAPSRTLTVLLADIGIGYTDTIRRAALIMLPNGFTTTTVSFDAAKQGIV